MSIVLHTDAAPAARMSRVSVLLAAILWLIWVVHGFDRSVLLVLLEPIRHEFGLNDSEIGFLSGLGYAVPFALAGIPLGALGDRVDRTRLLAAVMACWSAATLLAGWTWNFLSLLAVRALVGASESGAPPTILSLASDLVPPRSRPAIIGAMITGPYFGMAAGSAVAGAVAAQHGWRMAMIVAGIPGLVLAAILFAAIRDVPRGRFEVPVGERGASVGLAKALKFLMADPARRRLLIAIVLSSFVSLAMASWMPTFLMRAHGLPIQAVGHISGLALGLASGAGTVIGGIAAARFGRDRNRRILGGCGGSIIAATPLGVTALLLNSDTGCVAALVLWALASGIYIGPSYSALSRLAPIEMRGTMMAVAAVLTNLIGSALGPQLVGLASDSLRTLGDPDGLRHALITAMLLGLVPGLLFFRVARQTESVRSTTG